MDTLRKDISVSFDEQPMNLALEVLRQVYDKSIPVNDRKDLLKRNSDNRFVRFFFTWSLGPYETFGVKVPLGGARAGAVLPHAFEALKELSESLIQRGLTGGAARDGADGVVHDFGPYADLAVYFLNKETPAGIGHTFLTSVYPEELTKPFHLGMCRGSKKLLTKEGTRWGVNKKRDGYRCCIGFIQGEIRVLSKETNEWYVPNFSTIIADLQNYRILDDFVVDGEIVGMNENGNDVRQKAGVATRTSPLSAAEKENMIFSVFDLIPLAEWEAQKGSLPLNKRINLLHTYLPVNTHNVRKEPLVVCHNLDQIQATFDRNVLNGDEGIIAKELSGVYVFGDNPTWIKFKVEKTIDAEVVDFEEGTGRLTGMLGAFVVTLPNGVEARVGIMDDETRRDAWLHRGAKYKKIEFKCNDLTQYGAPNHAVYIRNRDDV